MSAERWTLPPEWAPQDAVMLTWPHAATDWGEVLEEVEPVFVEIARAVAARERLLVVTHDGAVRARVEGLLAAAGVELARVRCVEVACDDTWARDHGPLTVTRGEATLPLDFVFNAWGGKFDATQDDAINQALGAAGVFQRAPEPVALVLEGGSVEVDGAGSLLTTTQCLLNPNRNPSLGRGAIEALLCARFGVRQVLWVEHGHLEGDDTDAHIDTLARFAPEGGIVYVACDDPSDSHYDELAAMAGELASLRSASGAPYQLHALPWPGAKHGEDGRRLAASYANYLIINGAVLVPTYRDAQDAAALAVIAAAYPGREVIGIDCLPLIQQGGSLHCLTMQLPAGTLRSGV